MPGDRLGDNGVIFGGWQAESLSAGKIPMRNVKIKKVYLSRRRSKPVMDFRFADGSRKEKWLDCSYEDAELIVARLRADIAMGLLGFKDVFPEEMRQKLPFSRFLEMYQQYRRDQIGVGLSAKTVQKDIEVLTRLTSTLRPNVLLGDITPGLAQQYLNAMTRANYAPATVNIHRRHLVRAFNYARKAGLITSNPFQSAKPAAEPAPEEYVRVLTRAEISRFREHLAGAAPWQLAIFNFALWSGLRRGGLMSLKHGDVFEDEVHGQVRTFLRVVEKGNRSRTVCIPAVARQIIDEQAARAAQSDEALLAYLRPYINNIPDLSPNIARARAGYVFFEVTDGHSISQFFRRAAQKLEIKAKFHDLRDTHITLSMERGRSHVTASKSAGHSDFKTTEKRYLQITRAMLAEGIDDYIDF